MRSILEAEARAVASIPVGDGYARAVELIVDRVHRRNGKLVTSGMGKAGQIAMNIATTFCSTGTPAVFLHPAEAQHGDLGILRADDVLLLLSNSGKTREILELVELASVLNPGIPVIVITCRPRRRNPLHGRRSRSVPPWPDTDHLHHSHDRDGRRACGHRDGENRIRARGLCQASPRRLPGP